MENKKGKTKALELRVGNGCNRRNSEIGLNIKKQKGFISKREFLPIMAKRKET